MQTLKSSISNSAFFEKSLLIFNCMHYWNSVRSYSYQSSLSRNVSHCICLQVGKSNFVCLTWLVVSLENFIASSTGSNCAFLGKYSNRFIVLFDQHFNWFKTCISQSVTNFTALKFLCFLVQTLTSSKLPLFGQQRWKL